jgi:putative intracellular protease/amidase
LEDSLLALGGHYTKTSNWGIHVIKDGNLITGQNPASSEETAKVLLQDLKNKKKELIF